MAGERVTKMTYGVAAPVNELPWLRRKLTVRVGRRMPQAARAEIVDDHLVLHDRSDKLLGGLTPEG